MWQKGLRKVRLVLWGSHIYDSYKERTTKEYDDLCAYWKTKIDLLEEKYFHET